MADSNITKRALGSALRELMTELPFEKITITNICERCDMNRKSFYYHFRDKYDLVNWIFDTEFISGLNAKDFQNGWDFLSELCNYFYSNAEFYRKALRISGQNSFSDHCREMLLPLISDYAEGLLEGQEIRKFQIEFFTDGFLTAIKRWILEKNCMPPDEFMDMLQSCIRAAAKKVCNDTKN